jgi:putative phosphoribosyl transferase
LSEKIQPDTAARASIVSPTVDPTFADRREGGRVLAGLLGQFRDRADVLVLALPRGGVPVAFEVARALHAPLHVFLVRKLGVPGHEELAMGAIASGGVRVLNEGVVTAYGITTSTIDEVSAREVSELERRERLYGAGRPPPELRHATALIVDDGLATGSTMKAAAEAARAKGASHVVVAVPVGAGESCRELAAIADLVVCARTPPEFRAVGQWYTDFSQTTDDEVRRLLG